MVSGFIFIMYCIYCPIGFHELVMPFPFFHSFYSKLFYDAVFMALFVVVVPVAETLLYTVFFYKQIDNTFLKLPKIGFFYAGNVYITMLWTVKRMPAQLIFSALAGFFMMMLVVVREKKGVLVAGAARVGFAAGLVLCFLYMGYSTRDGMIKRRQPEFFYAGNYKNVWNPTEYHGGEYAK